MKRKRPEITPEAALIVELETHLQLTWHVPLARDLSEIWIVNARVRRIENDVVEEVERLGSELEIADFSETQVELSEQRHVNVVPMLPYPWVHFLIAVCIGCLLSEGAGIDPSLLSMDTFALVRVAHYIDTFLVAAAYVFRVAARGHRVRFPRSDLYYSVECPSSS